MAKKISALIALTAVSLATAIVAPYHVSAAVTGADWRAGRIIDDSIFNNKAAMSVDQIQQFLNAKVPTCDNWGTQPYGNTTRRAYSESKGVVFPLTCLKDYYENITTHENNLEGRTVPSGAQSAAQIIWNASQTYSINPQVLITLLQKEQSLVLDDWPWPIQYRSATGYGCPDSAACDASYYGFYNQIDRAAWQFRRYADFPNNFNYFSGRNNNIRFNANINCGSSTVFIENQATASLYNYTPYQPNQAALGNLYGAGDSCSAYGNRNFWRIFNDWFGPSVGPGYGFWAAQYPTQSIPPNAVQHVYIQLKNMSGQTWYSDGNVPVGGHPVRLATLGYANTPFANPSDPAWLGTQNQIKLKDVSVPDGSVATFEFTFKGPLMPVNHFDTYFAPVIDGVGFYPSIGIIWGNSTPAPDYSYQLLSTSGISANMPSGQLIGIQYRIKNTGNVIWYNDDSGRPAGTAPLRIMTTLPYYHASGFYDNGSWLADNQVAMDTPQTNPGDIADFSFQIKTPQNPGIYSETFGLVLDGATPLPDNRQLGFAGTFGGYKFEVISTSLPTGQLTPGEKYTATVILKNTGSSTWYSDDNLPSDSRAIRLMTPGYQASQLADGQDAAWLGTKNQVKLTTASVAPGENGQFTFSLIAPYNAGTYPLSFNLVLDGLLVIGNVAGASASVPVLQPSYSFVSAGNLPAYMSPNQIANNVWVRVRNTSNFVWYSDSARPTQFHGGATRIVMAKPYYRNSLFVNSVDSAWLGTQNQITMKTSVVKPGENADFEFSWKAPPTTGETREPFSLVLDGYVLLPYIGMEFRQIVN